MPLDPAKSKLLKRVAAPAGFWGIAQHSPSSTLYCAGTDFNVYIYAAGLPKEQPERVLSGHTSYVSTIVASAEVIVSGGYDRRLLGWLPGQEKPVWTADAQAVVNRLAISPNGQLVASAQDDLTLRLWEAKTGKPIRTLRGHHVERTTITRRSTLYSVAFSPDGKRVASGDRVGGICLWEVETGALVQKLDAGPLYTQAFFNNPLGPNVSSEYEWGGVRSLAFSTDGKWLFGAGMGPADQNSAGLDGLMLIVALDLSGGKDGTSVKLEKSKGVLYALQAHPEGRWLLGIGGGGGAGDGGSGTVCAWDYAARDADGKPAPVLAFPTAMVARDFTLSADGTRLLGVGMEKSVLSGRIEEWLLGP